MSVLTGGPRLDASVLSELDARLAQTDAFLARAYPGEDGRRQPVHTVYVPADRYTVDLPQRCNDRRALRSPRDTRTGVVPQRDTGRPERAALG